MCKKANTTVACDPAAVASARRWALAELVSVYAEVQHAEAAHDVEAVVSELVTNAVKADCTRVSLALDAHHTYVRIATSDDAPGDPVKRHPTPEETHGRGLMIVDALSTRWGVQRDKGSKTVWADIALHGDFGPMFDCTD